MLHNFSAAHVSAASDMPVTSQNNDRQVEKCSN